MKRSLIQWTLFSLILFIPFLTASAASSGAFQAVLFYSPSCEFCHVVMDEILPPLVEKYPNQLDIVGVDVTHPVGSNLYQSALTAYNVPDDRIGVPTLIAGSTVLVGADEIEANLPPMIETYLAAGGNAWPEIPGLAQVLAAQDQPVTTISKTTPTDQVPEEDGRPSFIRKFNQDPIANSIAVVVLLGMLLSAGMVMVSYLRGPDRKFTAFPEWILPLLAIIGLGVAGYMSFIEISKTVAVCGPVGNCNSVQESPYAYLFGVIPVGMMGVAGYLTILASWLLKVYGPQSYRKFFAVLIWGFAWFGVLFSIYLTFLEPFVIGASCVWCLTNAIIMIFILLVSTSPAKEALRIEQVDEDDDEDDLESPEALIS